MAKILRKAKKAEDLANLTMKIIFASAFYYRRGGLESYIFKAKELLESYGHGIVPFATDYYQNDITEYSKYFCRFYDVSKDGLSKPLKENIITVTNMFFNLDAYRNVKRLIKATMPDLLQGFNIPRNLSFSVFKAAKDMGIPTIMRLSDYALLCPCSVGIDGKGEICSDFSCCGLNFVKVLMRRCVHNSVAASFLGCLEVKMILLFEAYKKYVDYFIAPSQFIRNVFIKYYKIPSERIFYIPIFIDLSNASFSDSDDGFFLCAGRLSKEKGITTLLQAIKGHEKHKLIIAGTGPMEAKYIEYCKENKITNVEFVGFKKYEDLRKLIKRCRSVILPSEWYENSPNIVLEAYSFCKPVIASRIGGIPEIVRDCETGLLFEPKDHNDLSSKIKFFADHPEKAAEIGKRGRIFIEQELNAEKHYLSLMEVYNLAISK